MNNWNELHSMRVVQIIDEVMQLRVQGRHLREVGFDQLSHAAYRSARTHLRELRTGKNDPAPCLCEYHRPN